MSARLSPLWLLVALLACAEEASEGGGAGGAVGGGGAGGEPDRCPDLQATGECLRETRDGGCLEDEACGLGSASCGEAGACCTLPYECVSADGRRPGGFRCASDDDCASGACLQVGGVGICLRACQGASATDCPEGFSCRLTALSGERSVYSCLGGTAAAPEPGRTLCASDRDCDEGRRCRYVKGEAMRTTGPIATCLPEEGVEDVGAPCLPDGAPEGEEASGFFERPPVHCREGGACAELCDQTGGPCRCDDEDWARDGCRRELRCTRPCTRDVDCPQAWVCSFPDGREDELLSPWDLTPRYCRRPTQRGDQWACWDESDCCVDGVQSDGSPCCEFRQGTCVDPPLDRSHCRFELAAEPGRWHTTCRPPLGRAALGEGCALGEECESGLCDASGRCTSPCDLHVDVCGALLPGTSCCGLEVDLGGGALGCVTACRSDCAGACGP